MAKLFDKNDDLLTSTKDLVNSSILSDIANVAFGDGMPNTPDLTAKFMEIKNQVKDNDATVAIKADSFSFNPSGSIDLLSPAKAKLQEAQKLIRAEKFDEAKAILAEILNKLEPNNADAIYLNAFCMEKTKKYAEAYHAFNRLAGMTVPTGMQQAAERVRSAVRSAIVNDEITSLISMMLIKGNLPEGVTLPASHNVQYIELDPLYDMYYYLFALSSVQRGDLDEANRIVSLGEKNLGKWNKSIADARGIVNQASANEWVKKAQEYYWNELYLCSYKVAYEHKKLISDDSLCNAWVSFLSKVVDVSLAQNTSSMDKLAVADKKKTLEYRRRIPMATPEGNSKDQENFYIKLLTPQESEAILECKKKDDFSKQIPLLEKIIQRYPGFITIHLFLGKAKLTQYFNARSEGIDALVQNRDVLANGRTHFLLSRSILPESEVKKLLCFVDCNLRTADALSLKKKYEDSLERFSNSDHDTQSAGALIQAIEEVEREAEKMLEGKTDGLNQFRSQFPDGLIDEYTTITGLLKNLIEKCRNDQSTLDNMKQVMQIHKVYLLAQEEMSNLVTKIKAESFFSRYEMIEAVDATQQLLRTALRNIENMAKELIRNGRRTRTPPDDKTLSDIETMKNNLITMINNLKH